jgi:hypothetical protein
VKEIVDMGEWYNIISIVNMLLVIFGIIGCFFAFRNGKANTANEIQERVINALQAEVDMLKDKQDEIIAENARLDNTLKTIIAALKSRNLAVTIDGDMVNIHDAQGSSTSTRIQGV